MAALETEALPLAECKLDYPSHYETYDDIASHFPTWSKTNMKGSSLVTNFLICLEQLEYFGREFPWDRHVNLLNTTVKSIFPPCA